MQREDFRALERIEVRWSEVDAQKVVFNAHYLNYADIALTNYWRRLALPYEASFAQLGGELFARKATTTFHASARYGDVLDVGIRCVKQGNTSLQFEVGIFSGLQLLNMVELVYVFVDTKVHQPLALPDDLKRMIDAYESGGPTLQLKAGSWNDLGRDAERLRMAVFVREQGVPREIEIDELDPVALHAVVYNGLQQPVATGRLVTAGKGVARIGRMAVDKGVRGCNLGRMVLDHLVQVARERGDTEVILHAQCHAQEFYRRAGFVPFGEPDEEAGIAHVMMSKRF